MTVRPKIPLAKAAAIIMRREGHSSINIGNFGALDDAYDLAYDGKHGTRTRPPHPANKHRAVMDAIRRSPDFELIGYTRNCYGIGRPREGLHPLYRLTEGTRNDR